MWIPPTDPGTSPLLAQSMVVVHEGEVVRWANVGPADWHRFEYGLAPGTYQVVVLGWTETAFGQLSELVDVTVT